ncbi:MAG TPA: ComEA family DNA-binding protein [Nakamurella sp.]|nr:ComEA family DNA-binding protein [Nakamurella sp.]
MPSPEDDVDGVGALSVFGGWVPDDAGEWEGFDSLEPHVQPEGRTLPPHRAATGDDDDVDEHQRVDGNSFVDLDRTDDAEQDDADGYGGIRSDFDRDDFDRDDGDDSDGDDSNGDDGDGDDSDGDDSNGDDGDGDDLDDSDDPDPTEIRAKRLSNRHWGRLAELWVPESLRDARIDPGRRGLLVLLLVAAVAAVATAIGVWRDRPEPRPVETVALAPASGVAGVAAVEPAPNPAKAAVSGAVPTADGAAGVTTSTAPPTEIVVSVTGLVAHPGVVTLPVGARVTDAIAASGGSTAEADLTGLNLAAKLADGDSVVIAAAAAGGANSGVSSAGSTNSASPGKPGSQGQRTSSQLIDLNTADEAALDSLPGVGPVMAQNILAWRQQNGRFSSVEQLQEISGIGPARYAQISALVTVS